MQKIITLTDLESAINFWRQRSPSIGEEMRLCKEASSLATPYAHMIFERVSQLEESALSSNAQLAMHAWRETTEQ